MNSNPGLHKIATLIWLISPNLIRAQAISSFEPHQFPVSFTNRRVDRGPAAFSRTFPMGDVALSRTLAVQTIDFSGCAAFAVTRVVPGDGNTQPVTIDMRWSFVDSLPMNSSENRERRAGDHE